LLWRYLNNIEVYASEQRCLAAFVCCGHIFRLAASYHLLTRFNLLSLWRSSNLHLETRVWHELFKECLEFSVSLFAELSLGADGGENVCVLGSNKSEVEFFEFWDFRSLKLVEETSDTGVKDANLFFGRDWHVLLLFQQFSQLLASV